ncbi:TetR/AcrR family transcriptional regulator [Aliikangiella coralliicola]|uniref:TetR/AcrR family transcriptional regulator n=1 Tax=Aliikangiella coralliicola TaxID=2592383 RepID=A0A545UJ92_9GAMM|nr:TetR/AcrR family transcriptional regulator [Aliikangiella coralliicola]TQV89531.1 TetR/AcrR family transcriptional regulator [Aliikangiella coralliicola]
MSGRKQFDETEAVEAALGVFWAKGYKATSMSELESATGLNKSSIYNTFENKEALYGQCLERFRTHYTSWALEKLEHADFKTAITDFIECLAPGFDSDNNPTRCFATMAALEMGSSDSFVADFIDKGLKEMLGKIEQRLAQGVKDGQLVAGTDCKALAAMIVAVSRGAIVIHLGTRGSEAAPKAYECLLNYVHQQIIA